MPFVNVKLVEGVFTEKQKHDMAARLTDVMVEFEGSEAFREVVWVLIEELHPHGWHIGGEPFFGPATLMSVLGRSKAAYDAIDGTPTTHDEFVAESPDIPRQPRPPNRHPHRGELKEHTHVLHR